MREDGHYYLGTMDGNPVFGHGESAAVFNYKLAAEERMTWLSSRDGRRTFELEEQEPVPPKR